MKEFKRLSDKEIDTIGMKILKSIQAEHDKLLRRGYHANLDHLKIIEKVSMTLMIKIAIRYYNDFNEDVLNDYINNVLDDIIEIREGVKNKDLSELVIKA